MKSLYKDKVPYYVIQKTHEWEEIKNAKWGEPDCYLKPLTGEPLFLKDSRFLNDLTPHPSEALKIPGFDAFNKPPYRYFKDRFKVVKIEVNDPRY